MKKFIKTTCLVLMLIVMCLTLCSCDALDSITDSVAHYKGDDITFRDEVYKRLPQLNDDICIISDNNSAGYVTEPDVPVLLSRFLGNMFFYSNNGIIEIYIYDDVDHGTDADYFCREDLYEDIVEVINNNDFSNLCVYYYDYDKHCNIYQMLDENLTGIFKRTLGSEPINSGDNYFYDQNNKKHFGFDVSFCDSKMLVSNCTIEIIYDYYSGDYVLHDTLADNMYIVPKEFNSDIEALTEKISDLQD